MTGTGRNEKYLAWNDGGARAYTTALWPQTCSTASSSSSGWMSQTTSGKWSFALRKSWKRSFFHCSVDTLDASGMPGGGDGTELAPAICRSTRRLRRWPTQKVHLANTCPRVRVPSYVTQPTVNGCFAGGASPCAVYSEEEWARVAHAHLSGPDTSSVARKQANKWGPTPILLLSRHASSVCDHQTHAF